MNKPVTSMKSQLDRPERKILEDNVCQMRDEAENDIGYRIREYYGCDNPKEAPEYLKTAERERRERLLEGIRREQGDRRDWETAVALYVKGCAYTLINRLAAFRCMEVRGFLDRAVTRFRDDGVTPAADPLVQDEFLGDHEAVAEAFRRECQRMADAIEIVFDTESPYCALDVDLDNALFGCFETVCRLLDAVEDETWRADDVLGWVYEYYNLPDLDAARRKARGPGLEAEDVPVANQFYTPHWVVRLLTDNSLGKLYLEHRGTLGQTVQTQSELFTPDQRKKRSISPEAAPTVTELCTYLLPAEEAGEATNSLWRGGPEELRVIDPACGSGHFLLYAFDILERIWWNERPNVDRTMVPSKILQHNLFGVDLDMRACQLAAFNLYLKARSRAEQEGATDFQMPGVGIVCADVHLASFEGASEVFEEVSGGSGAIREVLEDILDSFESIEGLGSLLDVKGTLSKSFFEQERDLPLFSQQRDVHEILEALQREVTKRNGHQSIRARDLRSFLKLLVILSQNYDVALMNPPYGRGGRMPDAVQDYVERHYTYGTQYYINFFEVCERLSKQNGRVGMLVPKSFMYKSSYRAFRDDFISGEGTFEFVTDLGKGVLDNAAVDAAASVVRITRAPSQDEAGRFFRLHDVANDERELTLVRAAFGASAVPERQRSFVCRLENFRKIPNSALSYWVPESLRDLYQGSHCIEPRDNDDRMGIAVVRQGMATGKDERFTHHFWEHMDSGWVPFAKGGEDSWVLPKVNRIAYWGIDGEDIKRFSGGNGTPSEQLYFRSSITFPTVKSKHGRRFGILKEGSIFGHKGSVIVPDIEPWAFTAYLNSTTCTYLMLAQTPDRMWEVGEISGLPWFSVLGNDILQAKSRKLGTLLSQVRQHEFESPYYTAPVLLAAYGFGESLPYWTQHPHRESTSATQVAAETLAASEPLSSASHAVTQSMLRLHLEARQIAQDINEAVYDALDLSEADRSTIESELRIRYGSAGLAPFWNEVEEVDGSSAKSAEADDLRSRVQRLLLHLVFEILLEDEDGVVPLSQESQEEETCLLDRLVERYERLFGSHSQARLEETDAILGSIKSSDQPYPNIQRWLAEEFFEFQCAALANTPIIWQLSSGRLGPDSEGEAFACVVDYHQLDRNLFAVIRNRYLEKREKALRGKLTTARQRVGDTSLPATEHERWQKEEMRCKSGLQQIRAFRDATAQLKQSRPRDYLTDEDRHLLEELAGLVAELRDRTAERLETLDQTFARMNEKAFVDLFSPSFMEKVNSNREEWLDALEDVREACLAYAQPADTPVPAHYYDLFVYVDKVLGSTHYSSGGLLFLNYYFKKGQRYLDAEGELELQPHEQLLADLARETGGDVALGEQIKKACKKLRKKIPSDWKTRALEEVMVAGWNPVKKHGVAINIEPLAKAKIVPSIVEDRVI